MSLTISGAALAHRSVFHITGHELRVADEGGGFGSRQGATCLDPVGPIHSVSGLYQPGASIEVFSGR